MDELSSSTSEYSLHVVVVAHTKRKHLVDSLTSGIHVDQVFWDDGFLGEWKNHERAWRSCIESGKTHAVILQDDALPVEEFEENVLKAIFSKPESLISLYTGTHRPRKVEVQSAVEEARRRDASWLTADTLMWGVGIVVPVSLILEILETVRGSGFPYDQRIGLWAETAEETVYYTFPSLIDHADEPTVVAGHGVSQAARVAHEVGQFVSNGGEVRIARPVMPYIASKNDRTS